MSTPVDQVKLPDYAAYKVARELYRAHPEVESLLLQGRWRTVAYVRELEDDPGRPCSVIHGCIALGGDENARDEDSD